MPTYTTNYEIEKPDRMEKYNIGIHNANVDIIDAQMFANAQAILTKQNKINGAATSILDTNLAKDVVVITNSSGKIAVSSISTTKLGYLSDVTSNIQAQFGAMDTKVNTAQSTADSKVSKGGDTMTGMLRIKRGNPLIYAITDGTIFGTTGSDSVMAGLQVTDSQETLFGRFESKHTSDLSTMTFMGAKNKSGVWRLLTLNALADGTAYAEAPSWNLGVDDDSNKIVTIQMANRLPSLCHREGAETINGNKTFTSPIYGTYSYFPFVIKHVGVTIGTKYDSFRDIRYADNNGEEMGLVRFGQSSDGSGYVRLVSYNNSKTANNFIGLTVKEDKTSYAVAPTTPSSATSNEIATANWTLGKFVQKTGDTMTSTLTINAGVENRSYSIKRSDIDREVEVTYPESGNTKTQTLVHVGDKNNKAIAYLERSYRPEGTILSHVVNQFANGSIRNHQMNQVIAKDGSMYVTIPSWSVGTNDNSDKIVTIKMGNGLFVRLDSNQTIKGVKTFDGITYLNASYGNTRINMRNLKQCATPPTSREVNYIATKGTDKDGKESTIWQLETIQETSGLKSLQLATNFVNWDDGASNWYYPFRVIQRENKGISVHTINPSSDANGNEIATAGWCNGKFVDLSSAQTIGGTKTFSGNVILGNQSAMNQSLLIKHNYNLSDKTATGKTIGAIIVESADSDTNIFYNDYFVTTEYHRSRMASRFLDNLGVANGTHYIELYANSDGTGYATAPSPAPTRSALRNITISTSAPSGGNDGDLWAVYE